MTPTYIIAGVLIFVAFAILQYWTLKNGLSHSVRVMPLTIALVMVFLCLMLYSGAFGGEGSEVEGFKSSQIYGLAFGVMSACALAGDLLVWIGWKLTHKKQKPTQKKKK